MLLPADTWISQIVTSEKDYMKDRMEAIRERDGNPEGIEIEVFGNAVCLYSKAMPWPLFNTVKGMTTEDLEYIDDIIDFYKRRGRSVQFEIVPSRVDQRVLKQLFDRGLYPSGFHTSMYCAPNDRLLAKPEHVQIKEIDGEQFTVYAIIHCRGTGLSENGIPYVEENNKVLWKRPGWKFFMAYVSDQAAAVGVMFTKGTIASFTFAATLPEFRGRGLHQYLLNARMYEAFQQRCTLAVSQCSFLSQSHRNMERMGMKIGYVRTTWTEKQ